MEKLVSVAVPVYNAEKYLDRCIESIVNQTYRNLEIILVDDGSLDGSPKMCDDWAKKDNRIKVIHKENEGAGFARNTAIDCSSGTYVVFVDSDDYIAQDTVEKCVTAACENKCQVVAFGRNFVYSNGEIETQRVTTEKNLFEKEAVIKELLCGMFTYKRGFGISVWGKMYSLELIKNNSIRFMSEREIYSEDALFMLEVFSKADRAFIIDDNLYFYAENEGSLSRSYDKQREQKLSQFLKTALDIAQREKLPESVSNHIMVRYQNYLLNTLKNIMQSDMSRSQKKAELQEIYTSQILKDTLNKCVLSLHKKSTRLFYSVVEKKLYFVANMLLRYRIHKKA